MSVYLDHAATTPVHPAVVEAMLPFFTQTAANPHASHQHGRSARNAVERARQQIAEELGAEPGEIVFTSGGTESDNFALRGILDHPHHHDQQRVLITSRLEHHAILHTADYLANRGVEVRYAATNEQGIVEPAMLRTELEAVSEADQILVSLMHTNNEIGAIPPIGELANLAHEFDALFHTDAVQSAGKLPIDVSEWGVDMLSVSAHKFYGPKGVGLLYIRDDVHAYPLMLGGSQERDRRGGTLNVAGIVGLAEAFQQMAKHRDEQLSQIQHLKQRMWNGLQQLEDLSVHIHGPNPEAPLDQANPYILNVGCYQPDGTPLDASLLLMQLDMEGICVSSGSACTAGTIEPSHVLKGLGLSNEQAQSGLRFSFGKDNTDKDIDLTLQALRGILEK
ncbi:MAG: cysteine desulfurase family protein [Bacteroidota bacterium]